MPATRRIDRFVRRLESQVAETTAGHRRVALAYSGGLASTLLAMVARKRCELECVVAGREGSPDLEAARLAKSHLDYRVEFVFLGATVVRRVDRRLTEEAPMLSRRQRLSLVPLQAVLEQHLGRPVMAGFGSPRVDARVAAVLRDSKFDLPIRDAARGGPVPRALIQAAAVLLGLPTDWAYVRHRAPSIGAGIDDFWIGLETRTDIAK